MNRLLLDQGLPRSTANILNNADWEVVHVSDISMSRATDEAILEYARTNNYTCVTLDADFHALLAINNAKRPSVIRIRQEGLNGPALAQLLITIRQKLEQELDVGIMATVTEKTLRIHNLPIIKNE